jgi:peptidoglycan/xylan/chitin deacetylase (PgdA/CDA1 family)
VAVPSVVILLIVALPSRQEAEGQGATARHKAPAHRAARPQGPRRRAPVPVLMYHGVEPPPPGSLAGLFVKPHTFAAHVRALARAGFHGVTLAQVEAAWDQGARLPSKPIVFTFDDGYKGQYRNAMPVLRRRHWPGVLFLTVANMGTNIGITRQQVRGLIKNDWELGGHTFSHPDLRNQAPYPLRHEVRDSRKWMERRFGVKITNFAYPAGDYDRRAVKAVRDAKYRGAVTVAPGLAERSHPLIMNRIRISSDTTASELIRQLRGLKAD